jgi:hypothetical protein
MRTGRRVYIRIYVRRVCATRPSFLSEGEVGVEGGRNYMVIVVLM